MPKLYQHDCEHCRYYGSTKDLDFYICNTTVVARYSSEDSDYSSMDMKYHEDNTVNYGNMKSDDILILKFLRACPTCVFNRIKKD
jgi:hypothetical protein